METSRRGFMGLLSGLLLAGKVIGPRIVEAPTPELWKAAPRLPLNPITNRYVSLNTFTADVLKVIHRETQWLRLQCQIPESWQRSGSRGWRFGDEALVRAPSRFEPIDDYVEWDPERMRQSICDRMVPVTIRESVSGHLNELDSRFWHRPYQEIHARYVEPMGILMAEKIAQRVKAHGGAGLILSVPPPQIFEGYQSTIVSNEDLGLIVRGVRTPEMPMHAPMLRLDIEFGLA